MLNFYNEKYTKSHYHNKKYIKNSIFAMYIF